MKTTMHSSRMRTGRSLTICCSLPPRGVSGPGGSLVGGVSAPRGVCSGGGGLLPGGGCLLQGGCVCSGGSARGGVSAPGGCLLPGGLLEGGCIPACTEADTLPPPVDRILDTRL